MRSQALDPARLKCPLHDCGSSLSLVARSGAADALMEMVRGIDRSLVGGSGLAGPHPFRPCLRPASSSHALESAGAYPSPSRRVNARTHPPEPSLLPEQAPAEVVPDLPARVTLPTEEGDSVARGRFPCRRPPDPTRGRQTRNPSIFAVMSGFCRPLRHSLLLLFIFNPPSRRAGR